MLISHESLLKEIDKLVDLLIVSAMMLDVVDGIESISKDELYSTWEIIHSAREKLGKQEYKRNNEIMEARLKCYDCGNIFLVQHKKEKEKRICPMCKSDNVNLPCLMRLIEILERGIKKARR